MSMLAVSSTAKMLTYVYMKVDFLIDLTVMNNE